MTNIKEIIEDFDDWVWCDCFNCKGDCHAHAVNTEASKKNLIEHITEKSEYQNVFMKCQRIKLKILEYLLCLNYKKGPIKIDEAELMDFCKVNDYQMRRGLGDLGKGLQTLHVQLNPESFNVQWKITEPNIKQVAVALNIAMTGGNCTSWNPDGG